MTKDETAVQVKLILEEMSHICKLAKVKDSQIPLIIKRIEREDIKANFINENYKVLKNMYPKSFIACEEARAMVPEATWDYYDMMGFTDLAEQIILTKAIKQFRLEWKALPKFRKADHVKLNSKTTKTK